MDTLIQLLVACEALLRKVGENFWADKLLRIIEKGGSSLDINSIEAILSFYGGMGSFNDLIISHHNSHIIKKDDEDRVNNELNKLRNDLYDEASRLRRL